MNEAGIIFLKNPTNNANAMRYGKKMVRGTRHENIICTLKVNKHANICAGASWNDCVSD
jgi:hypothetical protein